MPKKPPPVSLRKPPAVVDPSAAERFVSKTEERPDVKKTSAPDVSTPEAAKPARSPRKKPLAARKGARKSVVARTDGRTVRRMTVYLPDALARKLAVYCAMNDLGMSGVVTEAVEHRLARVSIP